MTFEDKQKLLLADLEYERELFATDSVWAARLDQKIADMRGAINGSGTGDQAGRDTSVPNVPGGAAQTL